MNPLVRKLSAQPTTDGFAALPDVKTVIDLCQAYRHELSGYDKIKILQDLNTALPAALTQLYHNEDLKWAAFESMTLPYCVVVLGPDCIDYIGGQPVFIRHTFDLYQTSLRVATDKAVEFVFVYDKDKETCTYAADILRDVEAYERATNDIQYGPAKMQFKYEPVYTAALTGVYEPCAVCQNKGAEARHDPSVSQQPKRPVKGRFAKQAQAQKDKKKLIASSPAMSKFAAMFAPKPTQK